MSREQHAADWSAYIEHVGAMRWDVIFDKRHHSSWGTRELARTAIRCAKVDRAARNLEGYPLIRKADFDAICERLHIDPDDDALVERLVDLGWEFNGHDDEYIGPDRLDSPEGSSPQLSLAVAVRHPVGRWRFIRDGWLAEDLQETLTAARAARARIRECFRIRTIPPIMESMALLEEDEG